MNPLKKVCCRAFQTVFRLALPVLPYTDPTLLYRVEEAAQTLADHGLAHPLLVTDGAIRALGLTEPLEKAITDLGMQVTVYDGTRPNPTTDMVEAALALYRKEGCDSLIAFGGGSPMDCTKAVGARLARPKKPLGNAGVS